MPPAGGTGAGPGREILNTGARSPPRSRPAASPYSAGMTVRLTQASAPLMRNIAVREVGAEREVAIPAERALTVFVDKRELVTLMTLGAAP